MIKKLNYFFGTTLSTHPHINEQSKPKMSASKCQLCCLPFKMNNENIFEKYECECGRKVCASCIIERLNPDQFKCNICEGMPSQVLDPDYDCVCEICGLYDGDGFGIEEDEHGIERYMCGCCKNGCYKKSDDAECRCMEIFFAQHEDNAEEDAAEE